MKHIAIIYHDADFDGKLSNEVCRFHLAKLWPNAAIHSYGWDYGRPLPEVSHEIETSHTHNGGLTTRIANWADYDQIYIVDLSVDELMSQTELQPKIIWIDHHKSAMDKWNPSGFNKYNPLFVGYRINGVAACRLCWQWFSANQGPYGDPRTHPCDHWIPTKEEYVSRAVMEPELIRLAGEYDVWDRRDPDADVLQLGLRAITKERLADLIEAEFIGGCKLGTKSDELWKTLSVGRQVQAYVQNDNAFRMQASYVKQFRGLNFLVLNGRGNSLTFTSQLRPEHDALMMWFFDGAKVKVSLYHAPGHEECNLSVIASEYGGGGHRGACGFTVSSLAKFEQMLTSKTP